MKPIELFKELSKLIPEVKESKMFGADCLKTPNGKAAAMFWQDCLVVKLNGETYKDALSLDGSKLFEPMEGRPMKEWVQIPFHYSDKWLDFAMISAEGVRKIESKPKKVKK